MKKVKIMLLSLALFAVVGGALAFKAKFDQRFCYAAPYVSGQLQYCSFLIVDHITTTQCEDLDPNCVNNDIGVFSCTTLPGLDEDCVKLCPAYGKVAKNW